MKIQLAALCYNYGVNRNLTFRIVSWSVWRVKYHHNCSQSFVYKDQIIYGGMPLDPPVLKCFVYKCSVFESITENFKFNSASPYSKVLIGLTMTA